jgi:hypothetical protein
MNVRSKVGAIASATACLLGLALASFADDEKSTQAQPTLVAEAQRAAPNFVGISNWLNSGPLNLADLRGKVVLVDFWTYRLHQLHSDAASFRRCQSALRSIPVSARLSEQAARTARAQP